MIGGNGRNGAGLGPYSTQDDRKEVWANWGVMGKESRALVSAPVSRNMAKRWTAYNRVGNCCCLSSRSQTFRSVAKRSCRCRRTLRTSQQASTKDGRKRMAGWKHGKGLGGGDGVAQRARSILGRGLRVVCCACVCGWGGVLLGWRGVRVGEAANLGPYTVGGASSSGEMPAGALSAEIREDQTLPSVGIWGHLGKTQEDGLGIADAAWWDLHGMRVGESWALLHQGTPNEEGAQTAELREKLWEEYARRREEARGSEAGHGLAEGMRKEEGYITEEFRRRIEVNRLRAIERRKLKELRSKKVEWG